MGAIVLDANVVIAFGDRTDALHSAAKEAIELRRRNDVTQIVPVTVLSESLFGAFRRSASVAAGVEAFDRGTGHFGCPTRSSSQPASCWRQTRSSRRICDWTSSMSE